MNFMRTANKTLIPLLILAHLAVYGALFLWVTRNWDARAYARGFVFANVPLVALWLVWGRSNIAARVSGTWAVVWAAGLLLVYASRIMDGPSEFIPISGNPLETHGGWIRSYSLVHDYLPAATGAMVCLAVLAGIPAIFVGGAGFKILHEGKLEELAKQQSGGPLWQFSIWGILSLTTAVAVTIAFNQHLKLTWIDGRDVIQGMALALGPVVSAIVLLSTKRPVLWVVGVLAIAGVELMIHQSVSLNSSHSFGLTDLAAQMFTTVAAVAVVRLAGYRLVCRTPLSLAASHRRA